MCDCVCDFSLVLGTLYPAYASYKAVKTRNVKEYVSFYLHKSGGKSRVFSLH